MIKIRQHKNQGKNNMLHNLRSLFRKPNRSYHEIQNLPDNYDVNMPRLSNNTEITNCEAKIFYNNALRIAKEANELAEGISKIMCYKEK